MNSEKLYHLNLSKDQLEGASLALIPGDPARVPLLAEHFDKKKFLAEHREFRSYLVYVKNNPIVICSTGIGGPSTSICVEELAQLGIKNFVRVGTTGAIQPHIALGDFIITNAAVRMDGASLHFAPKEFPAVSDFYLTQLLLKVSQNLNLKTHLGITASSDTFYQGQERYDSYSGWVPSYLQGSLKMWQSLGVLNYEMESATLFTMCSALSLKSACISAVLANRTLSEKVQSDISISSQNTLAKVIVQFCRELF